jgi:hypothetical protein
MARLTGSLTGLLNPATDISKQYRDGYVYNAAGYTWMEDQTAIKHTTGTFSAGTVNGASQTGTTLTTNAITGTLKKGDIITLAGVNGVNRVTKQTTGVAAPVRGHRRRGDRRHLDPDLSGDRARRRGLRLPTGDNAAAVPDRRCLAGQWRGHLAVQRPAKSTARTSPSPPRR